MRLVDPTDFEVLEFLAEHGRNNAMNISTGLDRNRSYINTRLRELATLGLVERVGPAENSGLYEITARGRAALDLRRRHGEDDADFADLVDARAPAFAEEN
jgi:DNA-binding IclR family transcriptional regulator